MKGMLAAQASKSLWDYNFCPNSKKWVLIPQSVSVRGAFVSVLLWRFHSFLEILGELEHYTRGPRQVRQIEVDVLSTFKHLPHAEGTEQMGLVSWRRNAGEKTAVCFFQQQDFLERWFAESPAPATQNKRVEGWDWSWEKTTLLVSCVCGPLDYTLSFV